MITIKLSYSIYNEFIDFLNITNITFKKLRNELLYKNNGVRKYRFNIKEYDNIALIYYDKNIKETINRSSNIQKFEDNLKSIVIDKETLNIISVNFTKKISNEHGYYILENFDDKKWNNVEIEKKYDGVMITLFYHNNKWNIASKKDINEKYGDLFMECVDNTLFEKLNKDNKYYFILIHHRNFNLIDYTFEFGKFYKKIIHISTIDKNNDIIDDNLNIIKPEKFNIDNFEELQIKLNNNMKKDYNNKKITFEGFVIKYYVKDNNYYLIEIQTDLFKKLNDMKPNNENIYQDYLELYQKDKLKDFIVYTSPYYTDNVNRITNSMKIITDEILKIYFATRKKNYDTSNSMKYKNPDLYKNLSNTYKKILYDLHGLYMERGKNNNYYNKALTIHDVYHYLKSLSPNILRNLFYERQLLINKNINYINEYIKKNIIVTTLTYLMFEELR